MSYAARWGNLKLQADTFLPRLQDTKSRYGDAVLKARQLRKQYNDCSAILSQREEIVQTYNTLNDLLRDQTRLNDSLGAIQDDFQKASARLLLEQKGLAFYSSVLDDITSEYVDRLGAALSEVYLYVFQNPNKKPSLVLKDKYNKKVLSLVMVNTYGGEEHSEDLDEGGFSVEVVLGTVLLIYFILYNNLERVIFFDESFTGLADETASRFFSLLKNFTADLGFSFMLISHETRFAEYADRTYFVRGGRYVLERPTAPGEAT